MFKITKDEKGFTLIELMVVIVVIGILMGVMGTAYTGMIKRAENLKIDANLRNLYMAAKIAVLDENFPGVDESWSIEWLTAKDYLDAKDIDADETEKAKYSITVDGTDRNATIETTYTDDSKIRKYPSN